MEVITFPDTTAVVIVHLVEELDVPVVSRVPTDRPADFLLVRRTGGPRRNLVTDEAQLTVESWGATDEAAHDLAQQVRGLLNALPGQILDDIPIYRVDEVSGLADLPDPLSDQPRYTQTFSIAARGTVATGS